MYADSAKTRVYLFLKPPISKSLNITSALVEIIRAMLPLGVVVLAAIMISTAHFNTEKNNLTTFRWVNLKESLRPFSNPD